MRTVRAQGFKRETISKWFNKLIQKDDYEPDERNQLVAQLVSASKVPEDTGFRGKSAHTEAKPEKMSVDIDVANSSKRKEK